MASTSTSNRGEFERQRGELIKEIAEVPANVPLQPPPPGAQSPWECILNRERDRMGTKILNTEF